MRLSKRQYRVTREHGESTWRGQGTLRGRKLTVSFRARPVLGLSGGLQGDPSHPEEHVAVGRFLFRPASDRGAFIREVR